MKYRGQNYIDGKWVDGKGPCFKSYDPATIGKTPILLWKGKPPNEKQLHETFASSKKAFPKWSKLSVYKRKDYIRKFVTILTKNKEKMAQVISMDNGKPLWESRTEVAAMIGKYDITVDSLNLQQPIQSDNAPFGVYAKHRPIGVVAVFGPFNFPGHLPNGHIIPLLLAGNVVIFKPSEKTPLVAEVMVEMWHQARLPKGVLNLVQGGANTGCQIVYYNGYRGVSFLDGFNRVNALDGLFFTGSRNIGSQIADRLLSDVMLVLEMGGNNPTIAYKVNDIKETAYTIVQSAFISAGQRCTCTRRLIMPKGKEGDLILAEMVKLIQGMKIGPWNAVDQPFMGPLIDMEAVERVLRLEKCYSGKTGEGSILNSRKCEGLAKTFVSPIIVIDYHNTHDDEVFGPLLKVYRTKNLKESIEVANDTWYGLVSGIITKDIRIAEKCFEEFKTGIINWNKPTTGCSGTVPFGGTGQSGNYRPSGFTTLAHCSYPVAFHTNPVIDVPQTFPGLTL